MGSRPESVDLSSLKKSQNRRKRDEVRPPLPLLLCLAPPLQLHTSKTIQTTLCSPAMRPMDLSDKCERCCNDCLNEDLSNLLERCAKSCKENKCKKWIIINMR